jgi:predicted XRE-type DNA-binding protein
MKLNKHVKKLAKDLDLSDVDAYLMSLKSELYEKSADLITNSDLTHEEIAKSIGTSRARISRLGKMGENSISMELLIKVIATLEDKAPIKIVA